MRIVCISLWQSAHLHSVLFFFFLFFTCFFHNNKLCEVVQLWCHIHPVSTCGRMPSSSTKKLNRVPASSWILVRLSAAFSAWTHNRTASFKHGFDVQKVTIHPLVSNLPKHSNILPFPSVILATCSYLHSPVNCRSNPDPQKVWTGRTSWSLRSPRWLLRSYLMNTWKTAGHQVGLEGCLMLEIRIQKITRKSFFLSVCVLQALHSYTSSEKSKYFKSGWSSYHKQVSVQGMTWHSTACWAMSQSGDYVWAACCKLIIERLAV